MVHWKKTAFAHLKPRFTALLLVAFLSCYGAEAEEIEWVCGCKNQPTSGLLARLDLNAQNAALSSSGPGSGVTSAGLFVSANGFPSRWIQGDRSTPIKYVVDTQVLPAGITQTQALTAVADAFSAWSAATSLTFSFDGTQNLGVAANDSSLAEDKIYVQLHNSYGVITGSNTLGIGGNYTTALYGALQTIGGAGGQVNGLEFEKTVRGYVIMNQNSSTLQNATTLTEVLTHEIGHVLGLEHSSESSTESDPVKRSAQMYYRAHNDGRGASLRTYDQTIVQKNYPASDTPPWTLPRTLRAITIPSTTATFPAGVNSVQIYGIDRQSASSALTAIAPLTNSLITGSTTGTFTLAGNFLEFRPSAYYGENQASAGQNYASAFVRVSDGVNCSPWEIYGVVSLSPDGSPTNGGDGLPNAWMTTYFSNTTPSATNLSRPTDDPDGDGLTNLQEYRLGTHPKDRSSGLFFTSQSPTSLSWPVTAGLLYEIEGSQDLSTWQRLTNPVLHTDSAVTQLTLPLPAVINPQTRRFHRIRVIP
jgi:hypothetical protein